MAEIAEIVVHGVVQGQEISQCSKEASEFCGLYYMPETGIRTDKKRLPNNRMAYSLLVYKEPGKSFRGYSGRAGSYFGITVFLQNQQVASPDDLFRLLLATYNNYVKGKIIQEFPNGDRKWMVQTLQDSNDTVAKYVVKGFAKIHAKYPSLIKIQPLPPLPHPGRDY